MAITDQAPTIALLSQATAHHVQATSKLQISERVFAEAVTQVKNKLKNATTKSGKASSGSKSKEALLDELAALRDLTGVERLINTQYERSAIWGPNAKISPDGRLQAILPFVHRAKGAMGSIIGAGMAHSLGCCLVWTMLSD